MESKQNTTLTRTGGCTAVLGMVLAVSAQAQIGGSGRDGALTPTSNLTLDTTGRPNGFEFTQISIPSGVVLRLRGPHPAILRSSGVVTIAGTIDANGFAATGPTGGSGGPGGFAGADAFGRTGRGPAGGIPFTLPHLGTYCGPAGHATPGLTNTIFGNSQTSIYGSAIPFDLRGGSGECSRSILGGGGGGGTVAVLADGPMTVTASGTVRARGHGIASGGSVLLRSLRAVTIAGTVDAAGGVLDNSPFMKLTSGDGIVRIDAYGAQPEIRGTIRPAPTLVGIPHLHHPHWPILGQGWQVDVIGVPNDQVALFLGSRTANIPVPPLGTLRLDPAATIGLLATARVPATGVAPHHRLIVSIPNDPALRGAALHLQGINVQTSSLRPRLTNLVSTTIR